MAIGEDTIVVGAVFADGVEPRSGAAYVLRRNLGGLNNWGEVEKIMASDGERSSFFGKAAAISGDTVVIGGFNGSAGGSRVYIYPIEGLPLHTNVDSVAVLEGGTGGFQVKLGAQPSTDVTVSVSRLSGDAAITVQSGGTLTFTSVNWNVYQTVTLAAAEDADTVNGQATIRISGDLVVTKDVIATEVDNDVLNFLTSTDSVTVPEGGTASFQVKLTKAPVSNLTVSVSRLSGDTDITVQSGSSLTFTPSNWNTYQTVTLAAAPDPDAANGSAIIRISASGATPKDVTATEADTDPVQLVTDTDAVAVPEGVTASFLVKLSRQSSTDITVSVTHLSGDADITVQSGGTLTFTPYNWDTYQTVRLIAAKDVDVCNGTAIFRLSGTGIQSKDVMATEVDNDHNLVFVTDIESFIVVDEGTVNFQVKLGAQPCGDVSVSVARVSGDADITVQSGSSLIFTPSNWSNYQKVTLAVAEDTDGVGTATIRLSAAGIPNRDIVVTVRSLSTGTKLLPPAPQDSMYFGRPLVRVDGDTVAISANNEYVPGQFWGSVYVFSRDWGGPGNWGMVKKITIGNTGANGQFGISLALQGDTLVVGGSSGNGISNVYIFYRDQGGANNWGQVKKLEPSQSCEGFGYSVSIDGDILAVGAGGARTCPVCPCPNVSPAVYIFYRNQGGTSNWGLVKRTVLTDIPDSSTNFGISASVSGDTLIFGALGDSEMGSAAGAAYAFRRNQGGLDNWGLVKKITASDAEANSQFGKEVAIYGDTAVIGAWYAGSYSGGGGAAYIFYRNHGGTNNWGEVKRVTAADDEYQIQFGVSVSIYRGTVAVGAEGSNNATGAAYLFRRDEGGLDNWGQIRKITASDGASYVYFGQSVAMSEDFVVVAAPSAAVGGIRPGAVYVYKIEKIPLLTNVDSVAVLEGGTGSFQVKLGAQPSTDVTVSVSRLSGDTDITVQSGGTLTFTSENWNVYQAVTLAATEDADTVNGQATIRISGDLVVTKDVIATEVDNDVLNFLTSADFVTVPEGGTASFQVKLTKAPVSNLTVSVSRLSGDTDITVQSGSSLTFTPSNWNTYQTVTLAAAADPDAANGSAIIRISASGATPKDVTATEADTDPVQLVTNTNSLTVPEGGIATFEVKLSKQPSSSISVNVTHLSGDPDITVQSGETLTFTPYNWDTYQTVRLAAAEDADVCNGTAIFRLSGTGIQNKDVTATEVDNDILTFVTGTDSLTVVEGDTGNFRVKLSAQPCGNVSVSVARVSGDTDITVQSGSSLTFTLSNWNTYQTVTLAAALDADTSNGTATIRISATGVSNKDITAIEADTGPNDGTGPTLIFTSHSNNQHVRVSSITLTGTASDSGKGDNGVQQVTVNGARANNDVATGSGTATWNKVLTLNPGANPITVIAYDNSPSHNQTSQTITIYYDVFGVIYVSKDGLCNGHNPCWPNIQNGIAHASSPSIIEITQGPYTENIILDFDQEIMLEGGWDTNFTSCSSYTTIDGSLTITNGTIIIENIILK